MAQIVAAGVDTLCERIKSLTTSRRPPATARIRRSIRLRRPARSAACSSTRPGEAVSPRASQARSASALPGVRRNDGLEAACRDVVHVPRDGDAAGIASAQRNRSTSDATVAAGSMTAWSRSVRSSAPTPREPATPAGSRCRTRTTREGRHGGRRTGLRRSREAERPRRAAMSSARSAGLNLRT